MASDGEMRNLSTLCWFPLRAVDHLMWLRKNAASSSPLFVFGGHQDREEMGSLTVAKESISQSCCVLVTINLFAKK